MIDTVCFQGHVSFKPTIEQQQACVNCSAVPMNGDFIITYDVNRESPGNIQVHGADLNYGCSCSFSSQSVLGWLYCNLESSQDPGNHRGIVVGFFLFQTMLILELSSWICWRPRVLLQTSRHCSECSSKYWHNIDLLLPEMPKFYWQV